MPSGIYDDSSVILRSLVKGVESLAGRLLGCVDVSVTVIRNGIMTFKFLVLADGVKWIIRVYPEGRAHLVDAEPDLFRRCYDVGIPVPSVVADSRSDSTSEFAYVVYEFIEGFPANTEFGGVPQCNLQSIGRTVGTYLAAISELGCAGAGDLVSAHSALSVQWLEFVTREFEAGLSAIKKHDLLPRTIIRDVDRVARSGLVERLVRRRPANRLIWGDINLGNILVNHEGHVVGLIDFEGCLAGDPFAMLGYARAMQPMGGFVEALISSWGDEAARASPALVNVYAMLRGLRIAKFAHLPLPTGKARDPLENIVPGFSSAVDALVCNLN